LLRGNAGAVIVRTCDDAATAPICSKKRRSLPGKPTVFRYAFVGGCSGPVQGSPKSDGRQKMPADELMGDFPPSPDQLVTLSNWRKAPFSAWAFRNVRRLIPTADIAASKQATALELSLEEIGHIGFTGHDGRPTTLNQALRATDTDAFVVLRRGRIAM
jgi:hypothetical protein